MAADELKGPDLARDGIDLIQLANGSKILGHADGEEVLLVKENDKLFAVGAYCTHYGGPLAEGLVVGETVRCPWHHACFDLETGEALQAPALDPVACWRVEQRDGRAYVTGRTEPDPLAPRHPNPLQASAALPAAVVIIGAGGAGAAAAEMLRRQGYRGSITMIDEDPAAPCDRPSLSKSYLSGEMSAEASVPLRPENFYSDHDIALVRGTVLSIDTEEKQINLEGGGSHSYDALLLATGAEPRRLDIPGADASHVFTLRSFADSEAISQRAESAKKAVIIGAGFIGLEVAASLRSRGVEVHVISPDAAPLASKMGEDIARFVKDVHEENGVIFHLDQKPASIEEKAVVLENGEWIEADLVVVGIGVEPRTDLAEAAGLKVEHGVAVNEFLEASAPGVYAAGDIAKWPDAISGESIRVEHWVVAQRQGQTAARNILGAKERFRTPPFFWSKHYNYSIRYVGHATEWDILDVTGDVEERKFSVAFRKNGKTLAVASLNEDVKSLEAAVALERQDEAKLHRLVPGK